MKQLLLNGKPIGSVKGVLFDKDGTLSYSEKHLLYIAQLRIQEAKRVFRQVDSTNRTISRLTELLVSAYGLKDNAIDPGGLIAIASREHNFIATATILSLLGINWSESIKLTNEIFLSVDKLEGIDPQIQIKRYLLPGVKNLLDNCLENGIICSLISNDSKKGIQNFLKFNELEKNICSFWSAEHNPPKPNPKAVKELCKKIKLNPSECALIGDADSDLLMARQAGVGLVIGYTAGWATPPLLNEHQHLIHHWNELSIHPNRNL